LTYHTFIPREDIFVIRTDGSDRSRLTDDEFVDRNPRWSPNGREIAFCSSRGREYQIHTIRPDGSQRLQRTRSTKHWHAEPIWSPDPLEPKLAAIRFLQDMSGKSTVIFDSTDAPTFSEDHALPPWPGAQEFFLAFAWSPDGRKLAGAILAKGEGTAPMGIAVYSIGTRSYSKMFKGGQAPRWLPDSRRLLYVREQQLHVLDSESGIARPLRMADRTENPETGRVALSPDGRMVYLVRWCNQSDIWLLELR